jgi:hypothetical protein
MLLACATAFYGQTQAAPPRAPGLETEWDVAVILGEMGAHAGRLLDALNRVDVRAWEAKGASETYAAQLESSKQQAKAFEDGARALAADPDKLADALVLLFRIEGLDTMLGSLEQGIRTYQSPADAQALARLAAENGTNRERFRKYIVELAADREKQFAVMDSEAQRCRAALANQPPPAPAAGRKPR